ncbi:MAG: DUF1186 domain-containing protein [Thermoplasmata archaeon]|nr:DUF1186 domain-containing protein [Thermoplasmata archaeon]
MDTENLLVEIARKGLMVDVDIIKEAIKREDTPKIILEKFDHFDEISDKWFGIHALYILGLMRSKEAFEVLKKLIKENDFGDWTTEELCHIMANFGGEFYEEIEEIVMDRSYGIWNRDAAYRALLMIGSSEKLVELTKKLIREADKDEEIELICLLIPRMLSLRNVDIYRMCKMFVEKVGGCFPVFHNNELDEMWKEGGEKERKKDLWMHFSKENLCYLYKINYGKPKIGRNDPCICGSGKKYKNCCWKYFH